MKVELLVVPDCANAAQAEDVLREALRQAGVPAPVQTVLVDSASTAEAHRFIGSPSFYADGIDLFPRPDLAPALACRMYPTDDGLRGTPPPADLARALRAAADRHP